MKKYGLCKWAVAHKIDGSNYDDGKERTRIVAVFNYRDHAENFINKCLPEETKERFYIIYVDDLEREEKEKNGKKLIIDGEEKGIIKEYYQNRDTKAWVFVLEPTPGKESSKKFILFFDEIKRMSNDKDWNIDILTY